MQDTSANMSNSRLAPLSPPYLVRPSIASACPVPMSSILASGTRAASFLGAYAGLARAPLRVSRSLPASRSSGWGLHDLGLECMFLLPLMFGLTLECIFSCCEADTCGSRCRLLLAKPQVDLANLLLLAADPGEKTCTRGRFRTSELGTSCTRHCFRAPGTRVGRHGASKSVVKQHCRARGALCRLARGGAACESAHEPWLAS